MDQILGGTQVGEGCKEEMVYELTHRRSYERWTSVYERLRAFTSVYECFAKEEFWALVENGRSQAL